jgi:hypothetical protein
MTATRQVGRSLADRIAAALQKETKSEDIATLITEVEQARAAAEGAHCAAHASALAPILWR